MTEDKIHVHLLESCWIYALAKQVKSQKKSLPGILNILDLVYITYADRDIIGVIHQIHEDMGDINIKLN